MPGAGSPQQFNRYAYTNNNPLKFTDPTGHMAAMEGGGGYYRRKSPLTVVGGITVGPRQVSGSPSDGIYIVVGRGPSLYIRVENGLHIEMTVPIVPPLAAKGEANTLSFNQVNSDGTQSSGSESGAIYGPALGVPGTNAALVMGTDTDGGREVGANFELGGVLEGAVRARGNRFEVGLEAKSPVGPATAVRAGFDLG